MKASWMAAAAVAGLALAGAPAEARTVRVPRDFRTIQAAVDAAAPGDTIDVGRGTYTEEVVIGKDLDLRGAGPGATAIKSPGTLTSYGVHVPDGRAMTALVRVGHGARARISGLTVKGPVPCGVEVTGVQALQGATLDLSDARVTDIRADAATCAPREAAGRAVVFGMPPHIVVDGEHGSPAYGRISHVDVERYQHAGVSVAGPSDGAVSQVTIADNVIRGGWQIPSFQYGIDVEGALARVRDNRVDGNVCGGPFCGPDPINEAQGTGIAAVTASAGTQIRGNRLAGNEVGVYQAAGADCCRISGNGLLNNRYFGIVIQDGDGATSGNTITGGQTGIAVVADAVDTSAVLRGDRIRATTIAPVREIECCGFTATAIVEGER
jgi:parallel beta-helix repeat protein